MTVNRKCKEKQVEFKLNNQKNDESHFTFFSKMFLK